MRSETIQALLRVHGYEKSGGEVFLDWFDMAFCDLLDVTVDFQGKSLGLHLLLRGLLEARDRGCQHSAISTAYDNDRAFLFYSNHGYRVVDWTYEFTKTLV